MTHIRGGNHDSAELEQLCQMIRRESVQNYLEIGGGNGDSFDAVMRTIGTSGRGLAVDLPKSPWVKRVLTETCAALRSDGIHSDHIYGNSHDQSTREAIERRGPFDLVLIDADHRYDAVKADLANYGHLAPIVVLHNVTAPDDWNSDGFPNGVGRLWREVSPTWSRSEVYATPGSKMGFGVLYAPAPPERPRVEDGESPHFFIEIPAWGKYYVDLACRFTIPALLESLSELPNPRATFLIHTDDQVSYKRVIGDRFPIKFLPLAPLNPLPNQGRVRALPNPYWEAFKQAHKDGLAETPPNGVAVLLNSDVVVSRECFTVVSEAMRRGKKVVASVGIRTQIEDNSGPPIGASADDLFRWIWDHPHPITSDCIWGKGSSQHPTILFFEDDDGAVTMHCFHLTPMFIRKESDRLRFSGTIDDDLMSNFKESDIEFLTEGNVAFCEISPLWKTHPSSQRLTVSGVAEFWRRRRMNPHYRLNFSQRMRVLGNPVRNHPVADEILRLF